MTSGLPAAARAEEQPAILKAYGLDWIERVRDDAWPQPKAQRPVICLLDTGVDITPDTPADNPEGPIVARLALDKGTGFAQGSEWQHQHGTQMASIIAAPRNGWGTVGVFPQARIVSIRVTDGADTYITPDAVVAGVSTCMQYGVREHVRVAVVAMPESNYEQRAVDTPAWKTAQGLTVANGGTMVAAAGNGPADSALAPFSVSGAIVVAAGDASGNACAFVANVDQGAAVRGPGCFPSRTWPAGSSAATASVAALLGAMASRDPQASAGSLQSALRELVALAGDGRPMLSAARLAIRFPVVQSQLLPSPAAAAATTQAATELVRLWKPRVRTSWSKGRLTIRRTDAKASGRLGVEIQFLGGKRRTVEARRVARTLRLRAKKPRVVRVWIRSPKAGEWRSLAVRSAVR